MEEVLGHVEYLASLGRMAKAALAPEVVEALHPHVVVAPILARGEISAAGQVFEHRFVVREPLCASEQRAFQSLLGSHAHG
jgi:hypothetical protein